MKYNGHKNWNHWNVSLWLNNHEGLYRMMLDCVSHSSTKRDAAKMILDTLNAEGIYRTPDGATYNVTTILAAMVEL